MTKAGFVISTEYPFLGASPDGYVHDPVATEQSGLVEIKCPYKFRNQTPENAASDSSFYCSLVGECLQLKVHGSQLLLSNLGSNGCYKEELV